MACFRVWQGVCLLFLPRIGLTLFIVFYTFGNICALGRFVSEHKAKYIYFFQYLKTEALPP